MTHEEITVTGVLSDHGARDLILPADASVRPRPRIVSLAIALCPALLLLAGSAASGFLWLQHQVALSTPRIPAIDINAALVDATPTTVTIIVRNERVEWPTTVDDVRLNLTLWRSMHLAD